TATPVEASTVSTKNIIIAAEPPITHERLSAGIDARYHRPSTGISAIGASSQAAQLISSVFCSRLKSVKVLTTTIDTRAATVSDATVRYNSDGQKPGLKKPAQSECVSIQSPGVSCQERMPLIQNRLAQAASEYSPSSASR